MKKNQEHWNNYSEEYQKKHGPQLNRTDFVWGVWSIPELEVKALGEVKGKNVLELGCGAAQLSIAIAKMGGFPIGLDISEKQLEHAKALMKKFNVDFDLVCSPADKTPLEDEKFELVFCDHGAMTYSPTKETLLEAHRLLKSGGKFIFNIQTPLMETCFDLDEGEIKEKLCQNYFQLAPFEDDGLQYYQHTYGQWIKLFRSTGFEIIDLIELKPNEDSSSTFGFVDKDWAMKYPAENIWVLKKA